MFTITSFYTKNTPYEDLALELEHNLIHLDTPVSFNILPELSLDNWTKNTNLKSKVIKEMLDNDYNDIVFVDVDAKIHQYPSLFNEIPEEYDCALFFLDWEDWYRNGTDRLELCTGTMFFRNNDICKRLVQRWYEEGNSPNNCVNDQRVLAKVLEEFPELKIFRLPYEYCWINSLPNENTPFVKRPKNVVIEHFQISRKLKNTIRRNR